MMSPALATAGGHDGSACARAPPTPLPPTSVDDADAGDVDEVGASDETGDTADEDDEDDGVADVQNGAEYEGQDDKVVAAGGADCRQGFSRTALTPRLPRRQIAAAACMAP
mmetsp:Transcript_11372/g.20535  ORF Transcript_11372/g.20535 Transcript_11372/m.20535 type:complete len:111 (-) Transcript_11372:97-429(-)